jgi:translation initiation factor 3 subunit L
VPDLVVNFLRRFQQALAEKSVWELYSIYENSFNKLTEKFYAKSSWPSVETVASLIGEDGIILSGILFVRFGLI